MTQTLFPRVAGSATLHSMSFVEPITPLPVNALSGNREAMMWDEACALWSTLSPLKAMYPGFSVWYWSKVLPGLLRGTRHILRQGTLDRPSGIAILKRDVDENKICTLWVANADRGRGVGRELIEEAISWMGDEHPLFTVPAERYEEFRPLMERLRFKETARLQSVYRPGVVEHIYNSRLYTASHR